MSVHWSEQVRHAVLNVLETTIGPSPRVRFYNGAVPIDVVAPLDESNTMLVEFILTDDWMQNAIAGKKSFSNLPLYANAVASGNATFYRIYNTDGTVCHEQGLIDAQNIVKAQPVRVLSWVKEAPH